jgi:hypothetical protein
VLRYHFLSHMLQICTQLICFWITHAADMHTINFFWITHAVDIQTISFFWITHAADMHTINNFA